MTEFRRMTVEEIKRETDAFQQALDAWMQSQQPLPLPSVIAALGRALGMCLEQVKDKPRRMRLLGSIVMLLGRHAAVDGEDEENEENE